MKDNYYSRFDNEFESNLLNHVISNNLVYRLYYLKYYRNFDFNGNNDDVIFNMWPFDSFKFLDNMSREEGFMILSYLYSFIKNNGINKDCIRNVILLDSLIDECNLGFSRVRASNSNITNLFIIDGRKMLFKENELYNQYFNWYVDNVSYNDIVNIYSKYNIKFANPDKVTIKKLIL